MSTKIKSSACRIMLIAVLLLNQGYAQLAPVAQALYNECYNADPTMANTVLNNGTTVHGTADGRSFYLKWFPSGSTPSLTPVVVTLHGSSGRAFVELSNWYSRCAAKGIGIIALQWYRGASSVSPYDYFPDDSLYGYIDTALRRLKYPSNKAMYHGFSRGSARSYAIAYHDVQPGKKNYFCTILSNAGKPDSAYPLYQAINSNTIHNYYTGKKWAMYCAANDANPGQSGCQGMNMAKNWVIANGGNVGLFISGPPPQSHDSFHTIAAYVDSTLNYYLTCFNGTGIKENKWEKELRLFPNPTSNEVFIENEGNELFDIKIYNGTGILCKQTQSKEKKILINVSELPKGIYFVSLDNRWAKLIKD